MNLPYYQYILYISYCNYDWDKRLFLSFYSNFLGEAFFKMQYQNCKFDHSLTNSCCKDYFLNFVEGEKMEGSLILSSLGRKSKPHPPRNRSYQWRLLCLNQLVPFIVDYAYVIWSTFLYVTNCLYNGSLLNIYFPVLWCSVFLPLWLLLIYSKYDKFFFYFISFEFEIRFNSLFFIG